MRATTAFLPASPNLACLTSCDCTQRLLTTPRLLARAQGTRFAVLHGEGTRPSVSIYNMRDAKGTARG